MMTSYEQVLAHAQQGRVHAYDTAKLQLYGVGVGLGSDPTDPRQLAFLRDDDPRVLPSFATVAAFDVDFQLQLGIDWSKLLHASQSVKLHRQLPSAGELIADTQIEAVYDKPTRNASLLVTSTKLRLAGSEALLGEMRSISLARDFRVAGAPTGAPEALAAPPAHAPDLEALIPTSPQVALIYRLLGGRSLIHFDPEVALAQGFQQPVMHGLSTWGHACHGIVAEVLQYDSTRMSSFAANFSAPMYPGETLRLRMWLAPGQVHFEGYAAERGKKVLGNGVARFSD